MLRSYGAFGDSLGYVSTNVTLRWSFRDEVQDIDYKSTP